MVWAVHQYTAHIKLTRIKYMMSTETCFSQNLENKVQQNTFKNRKIGKFYLTGESEYQIKVHWHLTFNLPCTQYTCTILIYLVHMYNFNLPWTHLQF